MYLSSADLLDLLDRALRRRRRYEHELAFLGGRLAVTRFAGQGIVEHTDSHRVLAHARVALPAGGGARVAALTSSHIDLDGLDALLDRCAERALDAPIDTTFRDMLAAGYHASNLSYDPNPRDARTAESGPAWRVHEVAHAIRSLTRHGTFHCEGHLSMREGEPGAGSAVDLFAIGNGWDVRGIHIRTAVEFICTAHSRRGGVGWAAAWSRSRDGIDAASVAERAAERARRNEAPETLRAGRFRVQLDPTATATLLSSILPSFSVRAVREGRSIIRGGVRPTLTASNLSLIADPTHPALRLRGFDGEGVPTRPVQLVENGVQRELVSARADDVAESSANGYGPLQPSSLDARPRGVRLEGGHGTPTELTERTRDAICIPLLADIRLVDPVEGIIAGRTRHGMFERRNGTWRRALHDVPFTWSVFDLLRNVVDASDAVRVGDLLAPALVVDNVPLGDIV
jgi:hypothetical protein